jgi:DNA-binding NtrC family response regulator
MIPTGGILVIDSDETIRDLLAEFFGSPETPVFSAENIADALHIIKSTPTPVALIDVGPGSACPYDDIRQLRGADPDLRIILLSGNPTVESVIDALRMRVFDFVVKPFCLKDLRSTVDRALIEAAGQANTDVPRNRIESLEDTEPIRADTAGGPPA